MEPSPNDSPVAPNDLLPAPVPSPSSGCLPELVSFASAFALSCFSATFYYQVAKRPVWQALLFFVTLIALASTILTASLMRSLSPMRAAAVAAFRAGDLPQLSITDGELSLHGPEPFVRDLGYGLIVIDTTAGYRESDLGPGRYDVSILFTRTEYLAYEDGQVTRLAYTEVLGNDTFEFNADTIRNWLDAFVLLFFLSCAPTWAVGWLAYVALAGLLVWGVATLIWRGTRWNHVLIAGLYAVVPALYAIGLSSGLPWILPIILPWLVHTTIWIFALVCMLWPRAPGIISAVLGPRSLRPWRALIALPLLIMLWLPSPFDEAASWSLARWLVTALTMAVLIGLSVPEILRQVTTNRTAAAQQLDGDDPASPG